MPMARESNTSSKNIYLVGDLIGCSVFTRNGGCIGTLTGVMKTGASDVYIITCDNKKEILVPAAKSIVYSIDITDKKVFIDPPPGLLEINEN